MAIKNNVSDGIIQLATSTSDTALLVPSATRRAISSHVLNNVTSEPITVNIYESPDSTSAGGTLIAEVVVPANDFVLVDQTIGQSYEEGKNLIGVLQTGSAGDVFSRITYTQYTGTD